ncbi:putative F-box protein At3g16210 [Salvia hispanica]|uniref:putative F-box protein At3g16210 n=1 Tax=Salvia hispanica TaxID=49212 RepID=UPI002008F68F|nr:putative F-box protein At3g16210 [Salvia hispanica]
MKQDLFRCLPSEIFSNILLRLSLRTKKKQDLFRFLPSEIFTNILLRLSLQTIATCKCVCKPWRDLIESNEFLESHNLSKSAPALAVLMPAMHSSWFNLFKLEDEHEHEQDPITKFDFPQASTIQGSANGLLLLRNPYHIYICNPITNEFVELRGPHTLLWGDCYGFGVSRISGQHKIIYLNRKFGCYTYTLESGASWRSVEATSLSFRHCHGPGAFVNGNIHWLVSNNGMPYIYCFDVETECFSIFSPPPIKKYGKLHALEDCLYLVEECYGFGKIWLFEGYKCWRKLHDTHIPFIEHGYGSDYVQPIKVYGNGDMLMLWKEKLFLYYSNKNKSVRQIDVYGKLNDDCYYINSIYLTPSFLSLRRSLGMDNVMPF